MNRSVPLAVLTLATVTPPVVVPWVAVASASSTATAAATKKVKSKLVYGPSVPMRWGPVQVRIRVRGKKIINVGATAPTERPRSANINGQALPLLKQEVLSAQSAQIDLLSGATLTSRAYDTSLQAAIAKAHI